MKISRDWGENTARKIHLSQKKSKKREKHKRFQSSEEDRSGNTARQRGLALKQESRMSGSAGPGGGLGT